MGTKFTKRGRRIISVLLPATLFNFFSFAIVAILIGGTAINGYAENQQYFVADHDRTAEVTMALWI